MGVVFTLIYVFLIFFTYSYIFMSKIAITYTTRGQVEFILLLFLNISRHGYYPFYMHCICEYFTYLDLLVFTQWMGNSTNLDVSCNMARFKLGLFEFELVGKVYPAKIESRIFFPLLRAVSREGKGSVVRDGVKSIKLSISFFLSPKNLIS